LRQIRAFSSRGSKLVNLSFYNQSVMMIRFLFLLLLSLIASSPFSQSGEGTRCFEMRIYHAAPGKLGALNARFRDHTCALFEKHGMTNIGYWTPVENPESKLIYVLAHPSRKAAAASWKNFQADSAWQAAHKASEVNGPLVANAESQFFTATDFSPEIKPSMATEDRVFELRTYKTIPGNLKRLQARFRDHTLGFFTKHGMTNLFYWQLMSDQKEAENTLVYMLAHASKEAADASFKTFRADPDWIAAKAASEKEGGGSLTVPDGVQSLFLKATDYSQTK